MSKTSPANLMRAFSESRRRAAENLINLTILRRRFKRPLRAFNKILNTQNSPQLGRACSADAYYMFESLYAIVYCTSPNIRAFMTQKLERLDAAGVPLDGWSSSVESDGVLSYSTTVLREEPVKPNYNYLVLRIKVTPDESTPGACRRVVVGQNVSTYTSPIYEVVCDD